MQIEADFTGLSLSSASNGSASASTGPEPMEIGNKNVRSGARSKQRLEDFKNNACFTCPKEGCRPWKHRQRTQSSSTSVTNIETALAAEEKVDCDSPEN